MDSRSFFELVSRMRNMQKTYFATRSSEYLTQSKELERQVDYEIGRVKNILRKRGEIV